MTKEQFNFIKRVSTCIFDKYRFAQCVSDFIGCQFALESNFGNSRLAKNFNNFCGMHQPRVRITTCVHKTPLFSWAEYCNFNDCVDDFVLCLQYHKPSFDIQQDIDSYACFINSFYCLETDYIDRITSLYQQFKSFKNGKN